MKDRAKRTKADQDTAIQQPSAGPSGASAVPPDYGIGFLDRPPERVNRTGLPDRLKAGIESRSGFSMDDVRVHYNSEKPAQLQALAYTRGTEIHVGPGQERHLPHEAWHVVQQKQGRVKPTMRLGNLSINTDSSLESEAERMDYWGVLTNAGGGHRQSEMEPVIQLYAPDKNDLKKSFWIRPKGETEFVKATLVKILKDSGWEFTIEGQKERVFIASERNIKTEKEYAKGPTSKDWYFHEVQTYTSCQFPKCGKSFKKKEELYSHITSSHPFPRQEHYPYALFGGQNASSHVLKKKPAAGQEKQDIATKDPSTAENTSIVHFNEKTGDGFHSEWNVADKVPRHKRKQEDSESLKSEEEYSATSSLKEFMSKDQNAPEGFFFTGEPHCGICSTTLKASGLPTTYPSHADPAQSKNYAIPKDIPHHDEVTKKFRGNHKEHSSKKQKKSVSFPRKQFPDDLKSRQNYNTTLKLEGEGTEKENALAYKRFMVQSMALNKDAHENFFDALGKDTEVSREATKKALVKNPVPEHPETFIPYLPSPLREDKDEGYEQDRKRLEQQVMIARIIEAFKQVRESMELELDKKDEKHLDPLGVNNCLITAINKGQEVTKETLTTIRSVLLGGLDIPFGDMLTASPEVIYIIATGLELRDVTVAITAEGKLQQVFVISTEGNVIEGQGDEMDEILQEYGEILEIKHTGGNHFEFTKRHGVD